MGDAAINLALDGRFGVAEVEVITSRLHGARAVEGIVISLPVQLDVRQNPHIHGVPVVSDLRVVVAHGDCLVGEARDPGPFPAGFSGRPLLRVHIPPSTLHALERRREGGPMRLEVELRAELCVLQGEPGARLRGEAQTAFGQANWIIERDAWVAMLQQTGVAENVVAEIELPPVPSADWAAVWQGVRQAREALNRGGETAWKACISESRHVLEAWRDIEPLDTGGGVNPRQLTRQQRLDVIREAVHRYTHDAVHGAASTTSRDEAVMVLACVAGLLSVRKP